MNKRKFFKTSILYFEKDPSKCENKKNSIKFYKNGLLIIEETKIFASGDYEELISLYNIDKKDISLEYEDNLIMPGFIDTHLHYAQTEMIGSFGEQLLPWLEKYTFPTEMKYKDPIYAKEMANFFIKELFKNGTTTAAVFTTVHKESTNAIFEVANKYKMRLIAGKVMMDRNAPKELLDDAKSSYEDSLELIEKWHEKDRLLYAITPRFAPTSTKEQLELARKLKEKYPTTYIQTHLSENLDEIQWVKSLFPNAKSYLDVYDSFGLVTNRAIFGHAIYLEEQEYKTLHEKGASVSLCPTSNLFLGSGLFKIRKLKDENCEVKIGFGSDVGAGTTLNMIKTLNEAYKIVSLEQNSAQNREALSAFEGFYQITLGASISLDLEDKIGKLASNYEADFVVIDFKADEIQNLRMQKIEEHNKDDLAELEEKLFALMIMGDDRNIKATFVNGKKVY